MIITNELLYRGCLIASISHAIMTNVYPELSYEQSWDGKNYSIQNTQGLRGTITFEKNFCVGAIRNDVSAVTDSMQRTERILKDFPATVACVAREEALQYLLVNTAGKAVPAVTSMFWSDKSMHYYSEDNFPSLQQDIVLFSRHLLPVDRAIREWQTYYDMDKDAVELVWYLLKQKKQNGSPKVVLDREKAMLIPGCQLLPECEESFRELNIYISRT